jgi:HAD superfamily hydrolase (TIGR01509 family)
MPITWIFFDIGDVLFDEDVPHTWLFHTILLTLRAAGKDVAWDEWNSTRISLAQSSQDPQGAIKGALASYCGNVSETETLWHKAYGRYEQMRHIRPYGFLLNGITEQIDNLHADFHLGVVANQHAEVIQGLADYGIASRFDVIVISEDVHLFKPDRAIFQLALDRASISAGAAVYVGDRPDNDVRPAKQLGMRTVRLKRGLQYSLYNPTDPEMTADALVTDVSKLAETVRAVAS